jgi:hypothetical protein
MPSTSTAPAPIPTDLNHARVETAEWIYKACLYYNVTLTATWLLLLSGVVGGGKIFPIYKLTLQQIGGTVSWVVTFWVVWSYGWYFIKRMMLKRAGMDPAELREVFSPRLSSFSLESLLAKHSERKLRIIDMVARRGRTLVFIAAAFAYVYVSTQKNQGPEGLSFGVQANVFDGIVMNWLALVAFRRAGFLGNMMYGAQSRVLDGIQGRANALCIGTLWSMFRFVMIPLGAVLSKMYPPKLYAVLFAFIWISYASADYATEIFGSLWGHHNIRVWGIGDLNRKSWEGTAAGFFCCLAFLMAIAWQQHLQASWYVLAFILSLVNPLVELVSPRGTDDFTMATVNALICVGFGAMML